MSFSLLIKLLSIENIILILYQLSNYKFSYIACISQSTVINKVMLFKLRTNL